MPQPSPSHQPNQPGPAHPPVAQPTPVSYGPPGQVPVAKVARPVANVAPMAIPVRPVAVAQPGARSVARVVQAMPVQQPAAAVPQAAPEPLFQVQPASAANKVKASRAKKRRSDRLLVGLFAFSLLVLVGSGGAAYYLWQHQAKTPAVAKETPSAPAPNPQTAQTAKKPVPAPAVASVQRRQTSVPAASDAPDFVFRPMEVSDDAAPAAVSSLPPTTAPAAPAPAAPAVTPMPVPAAMPAPSAPLAPAIDEQKQADDAVLELYTAKKLLVKKDYPALRKIFADRFEQQHDEAIKQGLGSDYDDMTKWFAEHGDIQEELYTAIHPTQDQIPAVFKLFAELKKQFPAQIVPYANLAIATAVVWDDDRRGPYDYGHHARRCKAIMPTEVAAAVDNFKYLIETEQYMQGRIQYAPWELLVYVVDHRTPLAERGWAMQNFLGKRQMFGACYKDVPYDQEMLKSQSQVARLNDKPYTLPNLLQFGGVCAMQADFASRVGKSIGVPAAYVRGEAAGGEGHAWVMWVELKQATATGLVFTLESHGRYRGDKFYVGQLEDPQTAQPITDRDLELRLQTAGLDTIAKRQTALAMQAYPALCESAGLDTLGKLTLLNQIITASPGNEAAWSAAAQLARENAGDKTLAKPFGALLERLFATFARVPDFTWKVFGDFAAFQDDPKQKIKLYERLVLLYEMAGRPDLGCEARLALTDLLVEQKRQGEAVEGLAMTIKKFPDEGRYVPRMLDKIDAVCADLQDVDAALIQFYTEFLPLIPQMRIDTPSPYCMATFERAIALFKAKNQPQLAAFAEAELMNIKSGKGRKTPLR